MINKVTSLLVVFSFIGFLLSGCSSKNDSTVQESKQLSNIISATENNEKKGTILNAMPFSDGYAWVEFNEMQSDVRKRACINTEGKVQFILNDKIDVTHGNEEFSQEFKDGYAVVIDNNNIEYIIDISGNITASSKDGVFDSVICYDDCYFLVMKKDNNFHQVKYNYSIIDCNGNFIVENCFTSDTEISRTYASSRFMYKGENVFCYKTSPSFGGRSDDYDCINVKTKKSFSLKDINNFYPYNDGKAVICTNEDESLLVDANGGTEKINIEIARAGISNNLVPYQEEFDDSIKIYDVSSKKGRDLYPVGKGITAELKGIENEKYLILITDRTNSGDNKYWFVLVDEQGNNLFSPIEIKDDACETISCDRIVTKENVYDSKGNHVTSLEKYPFHKYEYKDNYLIVDKNYIDVTGNLLFENNQITL